MGGSCRVRSAKRTERSYSVGGTLTSSVLFISEARVTDPVPPAVALAQLSVRTFGLSSFFHDLTSKNSEVDVFQMNLLRF